MESNGILLSSSFAQLVTVENASDFIEHGAMYVANANDPSWSEVLNSDYCKMAFDNTGNSSLLRRRIVELSDDVVECLPDGVVDLLREGCNVVMKVFVCQCPYEAFLVARIDNADLFPAFGTHLLIDADCLLKRFLEHVMTGFGDEEMDRLHSFECQLLEPPTQAFGLFAALPIICRGILYDETEIYYEGRKKLKKLPELNKSIRKKQGEEKKHDVNDYLEIINECMSRYEKDELFALFAQTVKDIQFKRILQKVIDSKKLAEETKYSLAVLDKKCFGDNDSIKKNSKYVLCLMGEGKTIPLIMKKFSTVIYVMWMIDNFKGKKKRIVDICSNGDAFEKVYREMYDDWDCNKSMKQFKELKERPNGNSGSLRGGRLHSHYDEICDCLKEVFNKLDETCLPFLVCKNMVLAIGKDKISLPEQLANIKIK